MSQRPFTLFQRTGLTLAAGLLVFLLFTLTVSRWLIVQPVTERAAEELAALLELTAKVWVELPPWTRADYSVDLSRRHALQVGDATQLLKPAADRRAYLDYLENALARRFEQPISVHVDSQQPGWYWVVLPAGGRNVLLGFRTDRLQDHVPTAVVLIVIVGSLLVLFTSLLLVRRVTLPLSRLSEAIRNLGRAEPFQPVPETGPAELAELAQRINRTEREVRELLESRTTLLAGVSHDLRTPIARMQLELELLQDDADPVLVDGMHHDLEEMDHLIGRALELASGLDSREPADVDPAELLRALTDDYARVGTELTLDVPANCPHWVPGEVLRRVLGNLLENALRYDESGQVSLRLQCDAQQSRIEVIDRGPGIPVAEREAVLRPFYRIEASRAKHTGGSGLGLAIVAQLCSVYGWQLTLGDTAGGGLTVRVVIPAAAGPA